MPRFCGFFFTQWLSMTVMAFLGFASKQAILKQKRRIATNFGILKRIRNDNSNIVHENQTCAYCWRTFWAALQRNISSKYEVFPAFNISLIL